MTEVIDSRWFHWYERSWLHTIWWCSYIGIDNELIKCLLNELTGLYLLEHNYKIYQLGNIINRWKYKIR